MEIQNGSLVKFSWWSSYTARSLLIDDQGRNIWVEVFPGDKGLVVRIKDDNILILLSRNNFIVSIHKSMLEVVDL